MPHNTQGSIKTVEMTIFSRQTERLCDAIVFFPLLSLIKNRFW